MRFAFCFYLFFGTFLELGLYLYRSAFFVGHFHVKNKANPVRVQFITSQRVQHLWLYWKTVLMWEDKVSSRFCSLVLLSLTEERRWFLFSGTHEWVLKTSPVMESVAPLHTDGDLMASKMPLPLGSDGLKLSVVTIHSQRASGHRTRRAIIFSFGCFVKCNSSGGINFSQMCQQHLLL